MNIGKLTTTPSKQKYRQMTIGPLLFLSFLIKQTVNPANTPASNPPTAPNQESLTGPLDIPV